MQCLHQLRNGRCFITYSILSNSLGCRRSFLTFLSPNSHPSSASSAPLASNAQCCPPPRSSSRVLPFLLQSLLCSYSVHKISSALLFTLAACKAAFSHPSKFTVLVVLEPARASNFTTILLTGILWSVPVFSMYDSCVPNTTTFPWSTHGGQRSFDVSVQELHVALLAIPNEFQPRISLCMNWTTACPRISCTTSTALTSSTSNPRSVSFKTSNLLLCLAFVVPSVFSRRLHAFASPSEPTRRLDLSECY